MVQLNYILSLSANFTANFRKTIIRNIERSGVIEEGAGSLDQGTTWTEAGSCRFADNID